MTTKNLVNVQRTGWYNVADGNASKASVKTALQVGMLVVEDTPDANGNTLIPCPTTGLIMPAQVHLTDVNFRPKNGLEWGGDEPRDYIWQIGEVPERVQALQGYFYRVWFKNASGGPIALAKGDRLKPSANTAGMFELVTPDEVTLAGVVDLKNSLFIYVGNGETVNDTETALVLVERT